MTDEIVLIEDVALRDFNLLYNQLAQTNAKLTDSIAASDSNKVAEITARIQLLPEQIAKFNEKLKKLRDGK